MAASTVSLRYFVMGLLAQQSMSGYDIRRFMKNLSWLIGSPSSGSLYPILHALPKEGMATVEIVPGLDKPPKKIYTITQAGRQELQVWADQPAASKTPLKAFVMRLLLAGNFTTAALKAQLEQRRAQVAAHHDALHQAAGISQEQKNLGQFLAMDYGLAMASAELSWLDHTLGELSKQLPPQEDEQNSTASAIQVVGC